MIHRNGSKRLPSIAATALFLTIGNAGKADPTDKAGLYEGGRFVRVAGTRLHYVESGTGQPIILLHGNDGTAQDFTMSIFDQLTPKYRTLAFDRPGHGRSEYPSHILATPQVQAKMLHDALQELKIANPILVAHSWSGSLALSYALQYPESTRGLVLVGAMAYGAKNDMGRPIFHMGQMPIVGTFAGATFKAFGRPVVESLLKQAFMPDQAPKDYVEKFLRSTFRTSQLKAFLRDQMCIHAALRKMSPQYNKIALPVVIVTGDADRTVPPKENSYQLHQAIASSKLIVLHNAGHEIQFTRPAELLKAIDLAAEMATITLGATTTQVIPVPATASETGH